MADSDLTTLAAVRLYLAMTDPNVVSSDPIISALITSQSAWLTSKCRRNSFLEKTYTEVRNGNGARGMTLFNEHATSVASVTIDGEDIPEFVMPAPGETADPGWVLVNDRVELVDSTVALNAVPVDYQIGLGMLTPGRLVFTPGAGNVTIAYTAGWKLPDLPPEIPQAVIELVALRMSERDRKGIVSQGGGGAGGETITYLRGSMPPSVADVVELYTQKWVG
jgi:hypothetical protein